MRWNGKSLTAAGKAYLRCRLAICIADEPFAKAAIGVFCSSAVDESQATDVIAPCSQGYGEYLLGSVDRVQASDDYPRDARLSISTVAG